MIKGKKQGTGRKESKKKKCAYGNEVRADSEGLLEWSVTFTVEIRDLFSSITGLLEMA